VGICEFNTASKVVGITRHVINSDFDIPSLDRDPNSQTTSSKVNLYEKDPLKARMSVSHAKVSIISTQNIMIESREDPNSKRIQLQHRLQNVAPMSIHLNSGNLQNKGDSHKSLAFIR
jgi:hypothetical protein